MRTVTMLFYGLTTFLLGSISISLGGWRVLAALAGAPLDQSGFGEYPTEPYQSILLFATAAFSLFFVLLAVGSALTSGRRRSEGDLRSEDEYRA